MLILRHIANEILINIQGKRLSPDQDDFRIIKVFRDVNDSSSHVTSCGNHSQRMVLISHPVIQEMKDIDLRLHPQTT